MHCESLRETFSRVKNGAREDEEKWGGRGMKDVLRTAGLCNPCLI